MKNAFYFTYNALLLHSSIQIFEVFVLLAQSFVVLEEKLKIK